MSSWSCAAGALGAHLLVLCSIAQAAGLESDAFLLDPATGNIGGKVAVATYPSEYKGDQTEVLLPFGYNAYLTSQEDPDQELVFPCGTWFQPPPGRYRVRVEGKWQMSPFSLLLAYSGQPFKGHGLSAAIPVVEAGLVSLPQSVAVAPHLVLRLLHAGTYLAEGYPRWELTVRRPTTAVGQGVLMPEGAAVGALWDQKSESYVALSRPFEVKARQTTTVPLERPEETSDLVVQLQRATQKATAAEAEVEIKLNLGGQDLSPDLLVATANRLYAIWYRLRPGHAELRAGSKDSFLEPQPLELRPGKIERCVGQLEPVPAWLA
jgi:hypothetical protein